MTEAISFTILIKIGRLNAQKFRKLLGIARLVAQRTKCSFTRSRNIGLGWNRNRILQ